MATVAGGWDELRARGLTRVAVLTPLGLAALGALSILLRTGDFDAGLWVDEGLSFGIADRPLTDIPATMRLDGSPPLYYMLLHVYTRAFAVRSEVALHAFSLFFAILAIPVAFAFARALFTPRAGWIAATLVAFNPFLTQYAQEARMYSLVVLLSVTTCATFVGAFVLERGRRWTVAFALSEVTLLYTHNWGFFLGAGLAVAFAIVARHRLKEGLLAAAIIFVVYAPWLPTLAFQVQHTGAPWANAPNFEDLYEAPQDLLGLTGQYLLLVAGGAGLATLGSRRQPQARAAIALAVIAVTSLVLPWLLSQLNPAWALRYTAVAVGPLLLVAALGTARSGWVGIVAVALTVLVWMASEPPSTKSNVHSVTETIAPSLRPGDTVISTQPEQAPVLHYYLHDLDLRYATLFGPLADLGVTDWRDGTEHLERTSVARDLAPVLDAVAAGQRVALVTPDFAILGRWKAPWSALVRARSLAWEDSMHSDPRFRVVTVEPPNPVRRPNEVRATVFVRR